MFSKKYFCRCAAFVLLFTVLCGTFLTAGAEDYAGHFLLSDKDVGLCRQLTGDVELAVVLVSLAEAPWTDADQQALEQSITAAVTQLEQEAAAYGAPLDLSVQFYSANAQDNIAIDADANVWAESVLRSVSALPSLDRSGQERDDRPVIFCVNTSGRAFACAAQSETYTEYLVLFGTTIERSLRHELMHLYGAWDFYLHDELSAASSAHYPDSIMLSARAGLHVDSLTAYIIGWTQALDIDAQAVLAATAHLTEDDIWLALADNTLDGFHIRQDNSCVYTGSLEDGMYHGWGIARWDGGTFYAGDWSWSAQNGEGVYGWNDGTRYVGDLVDGAYHGEGTLVFSDGTFYTGEFVNGQRTGRGTIYWPDSTVYTGEFLNGTYHGQGTLIFSDGTVYTGGFADNVFSGEGTYVWPQGSYFKGAYENGTYNGYGAYHDINGTVMEGNWVDGQFVGE